MIVHELTHLFHRHNGFLVLEPLSLGLYTTREKIQSAIQYYISKPGFCDYPDAFAVRQRDVKGLAKDCMIFEVNVYFHTDDYESEFNVELGLYGEETTAYEALSTFIAENDLLITSNDLIVEKIVNRCILDKLEWAEGFSVSE